MTKELLTIEFRYHDTPRADWHSGHKTKTITIGVFDTLEEAVTEGNKALKILSEKFEVRANDRFKVRGLLGQPDRLVTNTCYPTKGIQYFAQITKLNYDDLGETITETFDAFKRYINYQKSVTETD